MFVLVAGDIYTKGLADVHILFSKKSYIPRIKNFRKKRQTSHLSSRRVSARYVFSRRLTLIHKYGPLISIRDVNGARSSPSSTTTTAATTTCTTTLVRGAPLRKTRSASPRTLSRVGAGDSRHGVATVVVVARAETAAIRSRPLRKPRSRSTSPRGQYTRTTFPVSRDLVAVVRHER